MVSKLSRRDFLKLTSLLPLVHLAGKLNTFQPASGDEPPNVIVILYDTLAALHLSLYGYRRRTSPNLERFAEHANVYHSHYSAANFTTPSTASLFTGTYPWTHRAYNINGLVRHSVAENNIFRLLGDTYNNLAYAQNTFADMLLYQFDAAIDQHEPMDSFALTSSVFYNKLFDNDGAAALQGVDRFLFRRAEKHGSLFLSLLNDLNVLLRDKLLTEQLSESHPTGLPRLVSTFMYFINAEVTDGLMSWLSNLQTPAFVYLHMMPPHAPYRPTKDFYGMFADGWAPPKQKEHPLSSNIPYRRNKELRQTYDEYIANMDHEFGRLLDFMEASGLLENSYVILTSDHGEMFNRGVHAHSTPLLYQPLLRIPLVISSPGQYKRLDIHTPTSNIDLLPTLLNISGLPIPEICEGQLLPGLGGGEVSGRPIFAVEAKTNAAHAPLTEATIALVKDQFKLIYYIGYKDYDNRYELYDLEDDPNEIRDLYPEHPMAGTLREELVDKLAEVNQQ